MDAIEYLKERKRMCDGFAHCTGCPLSYQENGTELTCGRFVEEYPEKTVELVEKWSKEHSVKTVKDDFLEKYPNAEMRVNGVPESCAKELGYKVPENRYCAYYNCEKCWNTPLN